jgi:DMSO/TMAO reductase YedYZ heme-binding membrane subunit
MAILIVAHTSLFGLFFPEVRRDFGEMAGNLLIAILFLSPIATITKVPFLRIAMGFRRELGILMGYLAIVHGLGYALSPGFFDSFPSDPQIVFGIAAIFLTFPLLLTSNTFAIRRLGGKNWKRVHALVYPMFVLVVTHRFLAGNGDDDFSRIIAGIFLLGSYAFLKYLAWKPESFPFLRKPIDCIAGRYKEYQQSKNTKSEALSSK